MWCVIFYFPFWKKQNREEGMANVTHSWTADTGEAHGSHLPAVKSEKDELMNEIEELTLEEAKKEEIIVE